MDSILQAAVIDVKRQETKRLALANAQKRMSQKNLSQKGKNSTKASKGVKQQPPKHKIYHILTSLHGYAMEGPYTPGPKDVWYCDYKKCTYTTHGIFRRYKIQNWKSTKFGKKYVLCDGCVRQYKKIDPEKRLLQQQKASNINVSVNLNAQPQYAARPAQPAQQYMGQPAMQIPQQVQYLPAQPNPGQPGMPMVQMQPGQPVQYAAQPHAQYAQQPVQYAQQPVQYAQQPVQYAAAPNNHVQGQNSMAIEQKTSEYNIVSPRYNEENRGSIQVIKAGWMMKKGDVVKSWKKRYFVLTSNQVLSYYESEKIVQVKGTCKLNSVKTIKKKSKQSFEIHTPKRKWCFACKDGKERDSWVTLCKQVAGIGF